LVWGLIGLVTAELLKANGCNVIGYDFDQQKVDMALAKGITAFNPAKGTDPVKFVLQQTNKIGADGVIITASNKSDEDYPPGSRNEPPTWAYRFWWA